jgi:hypothetical protein
MGVRRSGWSDLPSRRWAKSRVEEEPGLFLQEITERMERGDFD